jgi:non-lysosomal glucosylceramidase
MVTYGVGDVLAAGVPLGGIGAGKVEINNRGKMVNLTIANNWGLPQMWMRGFHILIRPDDGEPFFIESGMPIKQFYKFEPDSLTYLGEYPFATLKARKGTVEATVEVFSPIIPGNLSDSSAPAFGMTVRVEGSKGGTVTVAVSNIAGTNAIGRRNEGIEDGIKFLNDESNEFDGAEGELCLLAADPVSTQVQYNLNASPKVALPEKQWKYTYESEQPWRSIMDGESFEEAPHPVRGQWDDPAGSVTCRFSPGSEVRQVFSWYFTGKWVLYPYGHYYHNRWKSAEEVARYFLADFERLRRQSRAWHTTHVRSDLPDWLRDAIINSTYILSSSTWLDERGRFAFFEATKNDPMLGTIAQLCHEAGSLPVMKMFPELEKTFLRLLAQAARPDGYIPHDLGIFSLDHPTDGTTSPPGWKDLGPTFIMLVYRYYAWNNDSSFLEEMYPRMLATLDWVLTKDFDGDGIPDCVGGGDGGFDATSVQGRDTYTGSVFIASLIAFREASKVLGKPQDTERFEGLLSKARKSFNELYNGRYFEAWTGEPNSKGYLFMGQMFGDWFTETLGLEPIVEEEKIRSAYDQLFMVNAQTSRFNTPNLVHENGRIWEISCQAYSSMPRLVFALSGVRYSRGDKKWLTTARKEWSNIVARGVVWDQPSRIDGRTGKPDPEFTYLDHYIGSPAIWTFTL